MGIRQAKLLTLALGALSACGGEAVDVPVADGSALVVPLGFPPVPYPADNVPTAARIELGRHLFYDVRLSGNQMQACASCHEQARAFTEDKATSVGSTGEGHPRNSQSLTNVAFNPTLTWANPVLTELEHQHLVPIFGENPVELGVTGQEDEVLARFADAPEYAPLFAAAFPEDEAPVSWARIADGLASFSRSLISGDSPFDRFVYHGEQDALSASARRGMELFYSEELECHHCHGGFNFTESTVHADSEFDAALFHNTGQYNIDGEGSYPEPNTGVFEVTGLVEDMGRFRPPSLRNVAVTSPYMHDGSVPTLEQVIRNYEAGGRVTEAGPHAGDGRTSPLKSGLVAGFTLTDDERADLVAFLESLTDQTFLTDPRFSDPWAAR